MSTMKGVQRSPVRQLDRARQDAEMEQKRVGEELRAKAEVVATKRMASRTFPTCQICLELQVHATT